MKTEYFPMLRRFFLFTALIILIAGCGSGGSGSSVSSVSPTSDTSSASSTTSTGTGAIAVKVIWNVNGSSSLAKTTDKVLYAAPAGVVKMRFTVSGAGMSDIIKDFVATPGVDGSGQIDGIPAGTGRTVKAQGLDSGGTVLYQGVTPSNIDITAGGVTAVATITMVDVLPPVTAASPVGGTYASAQNVTLTANEPATIFYTTNGDDPSTPGSPSGPHTGVNITISTPTTLKFFAIDTAGNMETLKSETYTINLGSLTVTF